MNEREDLKAKLVHYQQVRKRSREICAALEIEDYVVQPVAETSPPKWHLAHTTWFFENFILKRFDPDYKIYNPCFDELFNSYYKSCGKHWIQGNRGILSRPTVAEVDKYRFHVDARMEKLLTRAASSSEWLSLLEVGLHHEQQHQELLLMDIKFILSVNPSHPSYNSCPFPDIKTGDQQNWRTVNEGLYSIGCGGDFFCYDNETPRHHYYSSAFSMRNHLVTNEEYLAFIQDKSYENPLLWLSDGWNWVVNNAICAPLYWINKDGEWYEFTLYGFHPLNRQAPVCHISYYEADAFARWRKNRLPREQEMEIYLSQYCEGKENLRNEGFCHPVDLQTGAKQLWTWTQSAYQPYPGFEPYKGALGEYNAKFMCNQYVLKGGAFATPQEHYRASYRNFYYPHQRWMFSGICLAKD